MTTSLHTPIAVVAMGCLLPGGDGPEKFWELVLRGEDAIVEMPPDRLDRELYYDERKGQRGKTYSTLGGLVPEKRPESADETWDVSHRLFCDVARRALESAGIADLKGRPVGVFVGHSGGSSRPGELALATMAEQIYSHLESVPEFARLDPKEREAIRFEAAERLKAGRPRREADGGPWLEARWGAELVAAELGLTGPNLVVDAACASSLVALALGAMALDRGDIELALVGGASYAKADSLLLFSQAQSCSATGTRPFDHEADGLIGSEGYVVLALKTEQKAREDGNEILAVIRGVGLSSDGRGRHLWAPQPEGQMAALKRAYGDVLSPGDIQYIEAHATSTQVGDATEIESLATFFGPHVRGKLPMGSVKSNLGHTLETAGLAAVLKVILAMKHGIIPPTANVKKLNQTIAWDTLPIEIALEQRTWDRPANGPRRAGVSAFGIGGLNVHLVLEEPGEPLALPEKRPQEPIAIVGRGVVLPGAHNVKAFQELLAAGRSALSEAPEKRWPEKLGVGEIVPHNRGGYVVDYQYDYLKHRVPPKQIALANPLQFMLLDATEQALSEAGTVDRQGTTVVVGTQFGGEFGNTLVAGMRWPEIARNLKAALERHGAPLAIVDEFEEHFFAHYPALLDETGSFTSSTLASRITKTFDFEGGAMAIEAGECSGLVALGIGSQLLSGHVANLVVCAGCQHGLDLPAFETMTSRGAFENPDYTPGEGVAVVLLKRLSDAQRDGNPIFGVLTGDATRYAHADPREASRLSSQRVLELSGIEPERVLAVEPGNATHRMRLEQDEALREAYPAREARRPNLMGLVGHLGAGEGLAAVIAATFAPREGVEVHHGISDSGQASQILLSGPPPVPRPDQHKSKLRVGAATMPELVSKLSQPGIGSEDPFTSADIYRCVLLSKNPAEMPSKLGLARTQLERRALLEEQGVYLGQVRPTRVAFMFSGQGSQYHGMLQDLVADSPAARRQLEEADRCLREADLPTFAELAWGAPETLDEDPVTTQVAVLVADMIVYAALTEAGFEPDCVAGHSFGEIPAMVAARVMTLEAAIRVTRERARALLAASPDGGLLSVQAPPETVRELMVGHPLHVTHHNAPEQTVVGGRVADLERFAVVLGEHGLKSRALKVPGALHTPLVKSAQEPLRQALAKETLRPPTRLFYSNVTNDRVHEPSRFVENLVAQLTDPIRYPDLLSKMAEDGVGVFLEVGPNQVLTGLHRQSLPEAVVASSDHPRRGAREQIERARAALEVVGAIASQRPGVVKTSLHGGEVIEFDATTARKQRRRSQAAAAPVVVHEEESVPATEHDPSLARLLIDFVVDLTGYPADVISLDWDLEADLGIDSIKRAQLVGEVSEALSLQADGGQLSLDSFRTLRQILDFVQSSGHVAARVLAPESDAVRTAFQRGLEYGRTYAASIRERLRQNAEVGRAREGMPTPEELRTQLGPEQLAELKGMAEGAGIHAGNLIAYRLKWGESPGNGSTAMPVAQSPTGRYVLRMVAASQPEGFPDRPVFHGAALILGDNEVARELRAQLSEQGVVTHLLQATPAAPRQLEELWEQGPIPHLFLATPHDPEAVTDLDSRAWEARRENVLMTPFWLCQKWLSLVKGAGLMEDATLVGLTTLGGDFGFTCRLRTFEGGALTGLLKAILIESWVAGFRHLPVKIVDAGPEDSAREVVAMALKELAVPSYETEVGRDRNLRRVVRPVLKTLDRPATHKLSGHWVCTGGARGITAYVAGELARRYGLTLHMVGRVSRAEVSPEWQAMWPERRRELKILVMDAARAAGKNAVKAWESAQKSLEIEDTLAQMRAQGIEAHYYACDVSDREALARVLDEVRAHGPISGVLHGAGSSRDAKFEHKEPDRVDQCFRAKIDGTLALMDLTRKDALQHFVAFGSISGRFGANGHADYSLANDMEAKLVDWYRRHRPEVAAVAFHWHAWGDVGMATKAETQLGLQAVDMQFMPAAEGLEHLVRELEAGAPEAEVLITDDRYYSRFYPNEMSVRDNCEAVRPLLDGGTFDGRRASLKLDPEKEHFLTEHLLDERPILPMVVSLELACETALDPAGGPFRLLDVQAVNGLRFHGTAPKLRLPRAAVLLFSLFAAAEGSSWFGAREGRRPEGRLSFCHDSFRPERSKAFRCPGSRAASRVMRPVPRSKPFSQALRPR